VTEKTASLIAVKVVSPGDDQDAKVEAAERHLKQHIEGEELPVTNDNVLELSDFAKIRQSYKISNASKAKKTPAAVSGTAPNALEIQSMERIILGVMAIKGS
jgi:hypothetical protein